MKKLSLYNFKVFAWSVIFFSPGYVFAQKTLKDFGLFPCDGPDCKFQDLITVANGIMNALFFAIVIISPLLIVRAGYYYVISGDRPDERKKANGQLRNLVIGLAIVACAYAIVKIVLSVLIEQSNLSVTF